MAKVHTDLGLKLSHATTCLYNDNLVGCRSELVDAIGMIDETVGGPATELADAPEGLRGPKALDDMSKAELRQYAEACNPPINLEGVGRSKGDLLEAIRAELDEREQDEPGT